MGEGHVFAKHESLELMEHRRMGGIGITPVAFAGEDCTEGGLMGAHVVDLYGGGVCTKEGAGGLLFETWICKIKNVLCVASRMILGEVEEVEIIFLGLDFWAVPDIKSHPTKNILHLPDEFRNGMQMPAFLWRKGESDIDTLLLREAIEV